MKLTRLRIAGFKSFVDPVEFLIEPGLTGVVGPNGCGKSNLVEAIRWAMGESSHKSLRASGMDDVIFAGTNTRPARNMAEVALVLDNAVRTAPAAFNDTDLIEISRKIERESGSLYRLNGREVRARDVQLLFADAATGARSPALVRQGQISEIINAKPSARRRILEDAAGVAGLYGRRHEAELRLKAADENLNRVDDVLHQIESQVDGLKRQSRQAERYRVLSAEIRKREAWQALEAVQNAKYQLNAAEAETQEALRHVTELGVRQAEAAKNQAVTAAALPGLREAQAVAGAVLQRLLVARETLDADERRTKDRIADLDRRHTEVSSDLERDRHLLDDADRALAALHEEQARLVGEKQSLEGQISDAQLQLEAINEDLAAAERAYLAAQRALADLETQFSSVDRAIRTETESLARFQTELEKLDRDHAAMVSGGGPGDDLAALAGAVADSEARCKSAEGAIDAARDALNAARREQTTLAAPIDAAVRRVDRLSTEIRTLSAFLDRGSSGHWTPLVDQVIVEKGFEVALGAAFGDDLEASLDQEAPVHWLELGAEGDSADLPSGTAPLHPHLKAPIALHRRLSRIGLVDRSVGGVKQQDLKPGQVLVSVEGDIWRWDGFVAAADAPTHAAKRLAEKNRLDDLKRDLKTATEESHALKTQGEDAARGVKSASDRESEALSDLKAARARFDEARSRLVAAERKQYEANTRLAALDEARSRTRRAVAEGESRLAVLQVERNRLPPRDAFDKAFAGTHHRVTGLRQKAAETQAAAQSLARGLANESQRHMKCLSDIDNWTTRKARALSHVAELQRRLSDMDQERQDMASDPAAFDDRRRALGVKIEDAEGDRARKADDLIKAERDFVERDREAKDAFAAFTEARERHLRCDMRGEVAREALTSAIAAINETFGESIDSLAQRFGRPSVAAGETGPDSQEILRKLRADRDQLGPVNLRSDEELGDIERQRAELIAHKEELSEAIRKLRAAIGTLNKEGRERILAAFSAVRAHFQSLFVTLFGGGTAQLELIESDDPLEAGLEIFVHPPGKKPSVMSLLSGGEQALTAIALIFGVFLTNPSPICVLDEVDAPLDDSNVERYCDLLTEMARTTETRFIVITHNPITMARMNRLYGVTMAERGVSQLVSVDLQVANEILESAVKMAL